MITPPSGRWTAARKAELIGAIAAGQVSLTDVTAAGITAEELALWQRLYAAGGTPALRTTALQRQPRRVRRGR